MENISYPKDCYPSNGYLELNLGKYFKIIEENYNG